MAQPVGPKESFPVEGPPKSQSNAPSSVPQEMGSYMPQRSCSPLVGRVTNSESLPDSRQRYTRGKKLGPGAPAEVVQRGFNVVPTTEGKQR